MAKTITLLGMKNLFLNPNRKIRLFEKKKRIYDEQWKMYFDSELDRQEFLTKIAEAEEDIRCGRVCTMEDVKKEFRKEFGIEL